MLEQKVYLSDFIDQIDVECPNCYSKASVIYLKPDNPRFTCLFCGKNKIWTGLLYITQSSGQDFIESNFVVIGKPYDCYFKFPLWYTFEFKENTFFAYNLKHLIFQKEYIEDKLRKRDQSENGWSNASLISRLPKWILNSNNREELLKKNYILEKK